jgi:hypothetical protein
MAIGNAADIGYGASITLLGSYQITDFSIDGFGERSVIDISSSTSANGYRIFLPGDLKDPGSATVEFNLLTNGLAGYKTLIAAAKTATTITFPVATDGGAVAGTFAADAFATSLSMALPIDDRMVGTANIKFSGEPTLVSGS